MYHCISCLIRKRERVDFDLQQMKWDGGNVMKYISLKESSSNTRFGALHINSMNNVEVQYEYIENVDLSETVSYQRKQMKFKEMIMTIKVNGSKLFIVIE